MKYFKYTISPIEIIKKFEFQSKCYIPKVDLLVCLTKPANRLLISFIQKIIFHTWYGFDYFLIICL